MKTLQLSSFGAPTEVVDLVEIAPTGPGPGEVAVEIEAAAINPMTAHAILHGYRQLAPGAWVAQTGASSATARYVVTLARQAGLRTLNVVRRASSMQPLLDAGADVVLVESADLATHAADAI